MLGWALKHKARKAPLSKALFVCLMTAGAVMMGMVPVNANAQGVENVLRLNNSMKMSACLMPDGKPRPVYGCSRVKGAVDKTTFPETAQIIIDRQQFHFCHAQRKGGDAYNPTVGWGTLVDTPDELKAGKCPPQDTMREWFMRDVKISYDRGLAQARMIGNDNACMVRTLAAMNHQFGDVRRKFPNMWAKLARGESCAVAVDMLTSTWYQQTCDKALDGVLALDAMAGGCKVQY